MTFNNWIFLQIEALHRDNSSIDVKGLVDPLSKLHRHVTTNSVCSIVYVCVLNASGMLIPHVDTLHTTTCVARDMWARAGILWGTQLVTPHGKYLVSSCTGQGWVLVLKYGILPKPKPSLIYCIKFLLDHWIHSLGFEILHRTFCMPKNNP